MKLENMMKMKKYNKEKPAINANVLSEIKLKVNNIKQFWILFTKNNNWILVHCLLLRLFIPLLIMGCMESTSWNL